MPCCNTSLRALLQRCNTSLRVLLQQPCVNTHFTITKTYFAPYVAPFALSGLETPLGLAPPTKRVAPTCLQFLQLLGPEKTTLNTFESQNGRLLRPTKRRMCQHLAQHLFGVVTPVVTPFWCCNTCCNTYFGVVTPVVTPILVL